MKITWLTMVLMSCWYLSADSCNRNRRRNTSVEVRGHAQRHYGGDEGRVRHHWDDGFAYGGESVDSNGNWGVEAGVGVRFRKRSVQSVYNITLKIDPCNFYTYDDNRDGAIVKEELNDIFGDNQNTEDLFKELDIPTGDGYITEKEFYEIAPVMIEECLVTVE